MCSVWDCFILPWSFIHFSHAEAILQQVCEVKNTFNNYDTLDLVYMENYTCMIKIIMILLIQIRNNQIFRRYKVVCLTGMICLFNLPSLFRINVKCSFRLGSEPVRHNLCLHCGFLHSVWRSYVRGVYRHCATYMHFHWLGEYKTNSNTIISYLNCLI